MLNGAVGPRLGEDVFGSGEIWMTCVLDLDLVVLDRSREFPDPCGVVNHVQLTGARLPRTLDTPTVKREPGRNVTGCTRDADQSEGNCVALLITHGHGAVHHHPTILAGDGPVAEACLDNLPSESLRSIHSLFGQGSAILPLGVDQVTLVPSIG